MNGRHCIRDLKRHPSRRLRTAGLDLLKAGIGAVQKRAMPSSLTEPDVVLYATWISVWGRWFVWLVGVFLLAYRPGFWYPQDIEYLALPVLVFMVNGVGLPDDYAERGRGFDGMRADAEQMGGRLIVESGEGGGGTTITCVVPKEGNEGGC